MIYIFASIAGTFGVRKVFKE